MSFGSLTAITQLVSQLQSPFVNLSGIIPQYIAMSASAERLMELDAVCGESLPDDIDSNELYQSMSALGADNLSFSYDRDNVLRGGNFTLPKGSFAVITGPSGVGKSTLLKLMLGIFHPESGHLYADSNGLHVPLDRSTRGLFAYVPQGNLLLSGSLREDLTITRPDASEADLKQAIHTAAMDEYLAQLPDGLNLSLIHI